MPHKMMNPQIAYVLHDNRLSIEARMSSFELLNSSSPVEIKITQEKRPDYLVETQFDLQDA